MTVQAKEILEALFSDSTGENHPYTDKFGQAVHTAIQALEEVEQYRALGTVEELKEAREKQVAKKPYVGKFFSRDYEVKDYLCSVCGGQLYYKKLYCEDCGQKIDWEEGGTSD